MKIFFTAMVALLMASCAKEKLASTEVLMEVPAASVTLLGNGVFENGPYGNVTGKVVFNKISEGNYELVLDSFNTNNGPDLYVYLSKEKQPVNFIEAGKLRSTAGKQVYAFSAASVAGYQYCCIHCKAYNHLFGFALIQ